MLRFHFFILVSLLPETFSKRCDNETEKNTLLWLVTHPRRQSQHFLFGTIHVPFSEVWNEVSDRVHMAFSISNTVLLEIDLHDEQNFRELTECKNLPPGKTVQTYMSSELIRKVKNCLDYCTDKRRDHSLNEQRENDVHSWHYETHSKEKSNETWWRKKPIWLLFLLYQTCERTFEKSSAPPLDWYIAQRAKEENKNVISIETREEQCNPAVSVSRDETATVPHVIVMTNERDLSLEMLIMISQIVIAIKDATDAFEKKFLKLKKDAQKLNETKGMTELLNRYKCGTFKEDVFYGTSLSIKNVYSSSSNGLNKTDIDEKMKTDMFSRRNVQIAKRLDKFFKESRNITTFAAIGAGHFFGSESILIKLQKCGYIITNVTEEDEIVPIHRKVNKFKRVWTRNPSKIIREDNENVITVEVFNTGAPLTFPSAFAIIYVSFIFQ